MEIGFAAELVLELEFALAAELVLELELAVELVLELELALELALELELATDWRTVSWFASASSDSAFSIFSSMASICPVT
jgi:hypothetical protein